MRLIIVHIPRDAWDSMGESPRSTRLSWANIDREDTEGREGLVTLGKPRWVRQTSSTLGFMSESGPVETPPVQVIEVCASYVVPMSDGLTDTGFFDALILLPNLRCASVQIRGDEVRDQLPYLLRLDETLSSPQIRRVDIRKLSRKSSMDQGYADPSVAHAFAASSRMRRAFMRASLRADINFVYSLFINIWILVITSFVS